MAFFGVTLETIERVDVHPNADRLEIASLHGMTFQFVIGKDSFKAGDKVLYFPIDSILPVEIQRALGVEGKLSGKNKDRIKTLRLRGLLSQGLVGPVSIIADLLSFNPSPSPEEITNFLHVVKYEPPAVICQNAKLLPLPCGIGVYDIEGADRFPDAFSSLLESDCVVMEKAEGSNASVTYSTLDNRLYVNQHRFTIIPNDGETHTWWKVAQILKLDKLAQDLSQQFGLSATVFCEMIGPGIQGNYYELKDHTALLFDIKIGDRYMDSDKFLQTTDGYPTVPVIHIGDLSTWLNGETVKAKASGMTQIPGPAFGKKLREGIVIKPIKERYHTKVGRLIIKQRDPIYLDKTGN